MVGKRGQFRRVRKSQSLRDLDEQHTTVAHGTSYLSHGLSAFRGRRSNREATSTSRTTSLRPRLQYLRTHLRGFLRREHGWCIASSVGEHSTVLSAAAFQCNRHDPRSPRRSSAGSLARCGFEVVGHTHLLGIADRGPRRRLKLQAVRRAATCRRYPRRQYWVDVLIRLGDSTSCCT